MRPGRLAATAVQDNSSLEQPGFREHKTTYGVVYRLPQEVNAVLDGKINGALKSDLLKLGLKTEAETPNIPHVTVVHIHSADPTTPARMLVALPKPPAPIPVTLKTFYPTEAAKGAGHPWWLDLGVVKSGAGFEELMRYNTVVTAALAPLRDGPLPRVTGPVYAKMADAARDLVRSVGVSGVNVVRDGQEVRAHNPHTTLVYSMTLYDRAAAGRNEAGSRQVQRHPARRHPDHLQGCLHRRDRFRRQRAARDLPHQPGRRLGDRRGHRQAGQALGRKQCAILPFRGSIA
ncbi:hypothetical protein WJ970_12270 [Achromobacter xylosoxidans]